MSTPTYQAALRLSRKLGIEKVNPVLLLQADKKACYEYLLKVVPIVQQAKKLNLKPEQVVDLFKLMQERNLTPEKVEELSR